MLDSWVTGLGIDLSDHHLRLAQVTLLGRVKKVEEVVLPEGIVQDEQVLNPQKLQEIVASMLKEKHLDRTSYRTTILVPESRVFSYSMLLDASLKGEDRMLRARTLAQKEIPLPFSQAQLCFSDGGREDGKVRTTVYALHNEVFDPLVKSFSHPSLHVRAIETNSEALFRLVMHAADQTQKSPHHLLVIVDVGHDWTTVTLYTAEGSSLLSRTIPHLSGQKRKENRGSSVPASVVDSLIDTLREIMVFSTQNTWQIERIVCAGVEAQDTELIKRAKALEVPCVLIGEHVKTSGISKQDMHRFAAAIGAAMRAANFHGNSYQHNFLGS